MACYGARTSYRTSRPEWYRDYWTERIGTLLDSSLRDRHLLPDDRTVDVFFEEYMADELGTLERVYDCAGIALTGQARAEISAYQAAHPRGKEGRVAYDLRRHFGVTPEEVRSRFGSYLERFPVRIGGLMSVQDEVDRLIDTRPGRELMRPVYEDPAHPVAEGIYRSGGTTAAYLLLTDSGRVIVNTGMGFEAPHHKRVFDAVRPGPTHYIITTQAHVDHVGGVDLFKEVDTTYVAQQNNQACQADDARIRALRMRTAGIWFDMLGTDARRIAAENPGVSMRQAEPVPDLTFDQRLALDADGLDPGAARRRGGDHRQHHRVATRAAHRPDQQPVRASLPALPQPQHPAGGPLPLRRAVPRERAQGPGPATRGARHRPVRTHRR